ncbi:MAG TPA: protein kinase, partial [Polyangiaceae bacterium]|nr:protein kinase [Polyangiaceae bacterium]
MDRGPLVDCPGADTLFEYVEGRAPPRARARVEGHVADCAACRRAISALAETTPSGSGAPAPDAESGADSPGDGGEPRPAAAEAPVPDDLAPGTEVGRYVVLGVVGRGGMGAVYAARDPALHRKVALKLLRGDVAAGRAQREIEARLRREAQAMARLAHPNVAAVYDVGQYGGRVFVAMEFVEGQTLARWFEQRGRPLRRSLELFLSAGRGLAAAHAAGLVHRDFKPQNVLVGDDGRVRVVDFGLARLTPPPDAPNAPNTPDAPGGAATSSEGPPTELASALTRPGALLGTPLYMAPELYRGEPADARSDQFSFAVALYEALYRQRPFAGADLTTLVAQAELGRVRPAPRGAKVPREVRKVLLRGLSASPT